MKFYLIELNTNQSVRAETQYLKDIGLQSVPMQGCYRGIKNNSHLVVGSFEYVKFIAKLHKQDSILMVDENNNGYLYYLATSGDEWLGKWHEVSKEEALNSHSWTLDIVTNKYYIVN